MSKRARPSRPASRALVATALAAVALVLVASCAPADDPSVAPAAAPSATTRVDLGGRPIGLAVGADGLWVARYDAGVALLDPATGATLRTLAVDAGAIDVALAHGSVWVSCHEAGTVVRLDPVSGTRLATIDVGREPEGLAVGPDAVWVTLEADDALARIDPVTDHVVARVPVGAAPRGVAVGADVWVSANTGAAVTRIRDDAALGTTDVGFGGEGVLVAHGAVWVATWNSGEVVRLDPTSGEVTGRVPTGRGSEGLAADDDLIWVAVAASGEVVAVDPQALAVVVRWAAVPGARRVAVVDGALWVSSDREDAMVRLAR